MDAGEAADRRTADSEKLQAFDPKHSHYRWKLWVRFRTSGKRVHFFWKRIILAATLGLIAGWCVATAAAWAYVRTRGFSESKYHDVALPWRWPKYRASLASYYWTQGLAELKRSDWSSAFRDLTAALNLAPRSLEIREMLGAFQLRAGLREGALATLRGGVMEAAQAGDEKYLRNFLTLCFNQNAEQEIIDASRRILPPKADRLPLHRFVAFQEATALYQLKRYGNAERVLADWELQGRPEGEALRARCEWKEGLKDQAMRRLRSDLGRFANREVLWVTLEDFCRELGRLGEVHHYAVLLKLAHPERPAARINVLRAAHALNLTAEVRRETDAFLSDFESQRQALEQLLQYSIESGDADLAARIRDQGARNHLPGPGWNLGVAESALVAKEYPRALRELEITSKNGPIENPRLAAILSGLKAVALMGMGDGSAELAWTNFLGSADNLQPGDRPFVQARLQALGRDKELKELASTLNGERPKKAALAKPSGQPAPKTGSPEKVLTAEEKLQAAKQALMAADYTRALQATETAEGGKAPEDQKLSAMLSGMRAVALFGAGRESAGLAWTGFLGVAEELKPADVIFLQDRLKRLAREKEAQELASRAAGDRRDKVARSTPLLAAEKGHGDSGGSDTGTGGSHLDEAEKALVAGEYRRALQELTAAEAAKLPEEEALDVMLAGTKATALFGAKEDSAGLAWSHFLGIAGELQPSERVFLLARLKALGREKEAGELSARLGQSAKGAR